MYERMLHAGLTLELEKNLSHKFSTAPIRIVLGSDNRLLSAITNTLLEAGVKVDAVEGYREAATLWQERQHDLVLLDVSHQQAIENALETALQIKRQNAMQFVGYLVDNNLHTSSLPGDAVLPRNTAHLSLALKTLLPQMLNQGRN